MRNWDCSKTRETSLTDRKGGTRLIGRGMSNALIETAASSGVFFIVTLLTGVIVARELGPDIRGEYGIILFYAQLAPFVFGLSAHEAVIVKTRKEETDPTRAISALTLLVGFSTILVVAACFIAVKFDLISSPNVNSIFAFTIVVASTAAVLLHKMFLSIEAARLNFRKMNIDRLMTPFLFLVATAAVCLLGFASLELILILFVATHFPMILIWCYRYRDTVFAAFDIEFLKSLTCLAVKLHLAVLPLALVLHFDRFIPIQLWNLEQLGYYFVAYTVAGAGLGLVMQSIRAVMLPSLAGQSPKQGRNAIEKAVRTMIWFAIITAIVILVTAPPLVPFIFGEQYKPAVGYAQTLAFAMVLMPTRTITQIATRASGLAMPGVEMAITLMIVYSFGYVVFEYDKPTELFFAIFLGDLIAILVATRRLKKLFGVSLKNYIPRFSDLDNLKDRVSSYRSTWCN